MTKKQLAMAPAMKSKEALNNQFVGASAVITDLFVKEMLKESPLVEALKKGERERKIVALMKSNGIGRAHATRLIKARDAKERKEWSKHYDSPLGKAERRIKELEAHLELIKEVINDPNYLDKFP